MNALRPQLSAQPRETVKRLQTAEPVPADDPFARQRSIEAVVDDALSPAKPGRAKTGRQLEVDRVVADSFASPLEGLRSDSSETPRA
jgi:hypothetical protein